MPSLSGTGGGGGAPFPGLAAGVLGLLPPLALPLVAAAAAAAAASSAAFALAAISSGVGSRYCGGVQDVDGFGK